MTTGSADDMPRAPESAERKVRTERSRDSLPGQRAALRPGTLREQPPEPQGDENREPITPSTPPP